MRALFRTSIPSECRESRRLQEALGKLPLIPCDKRTRRRRDKLQDQLLEAAHKEFCVPEINLNAGTV